MADTTYRGAILTQNQYDQNTLIENVAIVPTQWRDMLRPKALSAEQLLLCEILIDAIQCYQMVGSITHHFKQPAANKRYRLHVEAAAWIFGDDTALFTFNDVCQALDIEPGWIRKALLAWKEEGRGPIRIERTVRHSNGAAPTVNRVRIVKETA